MTGAAAAIEATHLRPGMSAVEIGVRQANADGRLTQTCVTLGFAGRVVFDGYDGIESGLDAFDSHCADMLADTSPGTTERLLDPTGAFPKLAATLIPAAFARTMAALGVNPVAIAALTCFGIDEYVFEDGILDGHTMTVDAEGIHPEGPLHIVTIEQPGRLVWEATWNDVLVTCAAIPETIVPSLAGKRLAEIVTSPLTDLLSTDIHSASMESQGLRILLADAIAKDATPLAEIAKSVLKHR